MHAWPAPQRPPCPGPGSRFGSTTRRTRRDQAHRAGSDRPDVRVRHHAVRRHALGHAATYVAFDLVNRVWRDAGHQVHYVQNVTDVDDPLLERAARDGEDWTELADRETALFREDMTALRVLPPDHYVGAVEAVPEVVGAVELLANGSGVPGRRRHVLLGGRAPGFGSVED